MNTLITNKGKTKRKRLFYMTFVFILSLILMYVGYLQYPNYSWSDVGIGKENFNQLGLVADNGNWTVMNEYNGQSNSLVIFRRGTLPINEKQPSFLNNIINRIVVQKKTISTDQAKYINLVKNGIFYSNMTKGGLLYRTNLEGKEKKALTKNAVTHVMVQGEWIYFIEFSQQTKNQLYRMRVDGTKKEVVLEESMLDYEMDGDWVYFTNTHDNLSLYRIKKDGSGKEKLTDHPSNHPQLYGKWVYYLQSLDTGDLYRVPKNGGTPEKIVDRNLESFLVYQGNLYYSTAYAWEERGLYQSDINGQKEKKIMDRWIFGFNVADEKLIGVDYESFQPVMIPMKQSE